MKFQRFFVVLGSFGGRFGDPRSTKRDTFLRVVARRVPRRVPVPLRGRFWVSPGWPGGASGVPRDGLEGPPGITSLLLGSLWELSEDLLKVPGIFLVLPEGFFRDFRIFFPCFPSLSFAFPHFPLLSPAFLCFPCFPLLSPCSPLLSFAFLGFCLQIVANSSKQEQLTANTSN